MTIDNILNSGRTGKRQTVYAKTLGKLRKKYEISERRQGVQHITSVRGIVKPAFQMSYEEDSLNTSSTSNKVDTANDKCTFAGKLADGNYVWSVTENGTTVASGSFTLDRGV